MSRIKFGLSCVSGSVKKYEAGVMKQNVKKAGATSTRVCPVCLLFEVAPNSVLPASRHLVSLEWGWGLKRREHERAVQGELRVERRHFFANPDGAPLPF